MYVSASGNTAKVREFLVLRYLLWYLLFKLIVKSLTVDLGYIEPGHGRKGRKQWLNTDSDVEEMYKKHLAKLWAYSCATSSTKKKPVKRVESTFAGHKESLS